MEPHDYRHWYGFSVAESQTFLRAKLHKRRRARRNGCFRRLTWQHPEQDLEGVCTWTGSHYLWHLQPVVKEGVSVFHLCSGTSSLPLFLCPPGAIENDVRPISLTCTVSKIMEGFTCTRLLPQLEDKIDPRQYTRKGHWTLDALLYKIISSDIRGGGHAVVRHVLRPFSLISLRDLILLITLF